MIKSSRTKTFETNRTGQAKIFCKLFKLAFQATLAKNLEHIIRMAFMELRKSFDGHRMIFLLFQSTGCGNYLASSPRKRLWHRVGNWIQNHRTLSLQRQWKELLLSIRLKHDFRSLAIQHISHNGQYTITREVEARIVTHRNDNLIRHADGSYKRIHILMGKERNECRQWITLHCTSNITNLLQWINRRVGNVVDDRNTFRN